MTNSNHPLVQSLRDHARNVRTSILKDGPYPKLFEHAADEIERLTSIVLGLTAGARRAGYDCSHCHTQIVFGDSVCPVTKEQHAAPVSPEWPLCEKCQKRMIQVAHDTWEHNCEHGTPEKSDERQNPT